MVRDPRSHEEKPHAEREDENLEADLEEFRTSAGIYSFSPDSSDAVDVADRCSSFDFEDWGEEEEEEEEEFDQVPPMLHTHGAAAPPRHHQPASQHPELVAPTNKLHHNGTHWSVTYAGETVSLGNLDGVLYMSYAMERPGPEGVRLLEIEMAVHGRTNAYQEEDRRDAQALLVGSGSDDEEQEAAGHRSVSPGFRTVSYSEATSIEGRATLAGYRFALKQLKQDIYEARAHGDTGHLQNLQEQMKQLRAALRIVENQSKRGPENEGPSKGHIVRIRNAINYAKDTALPKCHPAFAQHLQEYLVCESNCAVYNPPAPTRWSIQRPR